MIRSKLWLLLILSAIPLKILGMSGMGMQPKEGLPLFFWKEGPFINFGDHLSLKLVERIVGTDLDYYCKRLKRPVKKLLAIGSVFYFATNDDVIWGSGINGKTLEKKHYEFTRLDVRAVRGPLTRQFLKEHFQIDCPEIYGDPALLFPYLFPEFKRKIFPTYSYIIIPHFLELYLFPKSKYPNVVYPTDPWNEVIEKILDSAFVISSSLHGIVIAESYGIPARLLRVTENQNLFKYQDYYLGTNRPNFQYAQSIEEALEMGGEPPFECDLQKLYEAFPFEFWPNARICVPNIPTNGRL